MRRIAELTAVAALLAGCATAAHEAGKEAAQGAIAGASEQSPADQGTGSQLAKATEGVSQGAVSGMLEQLRQPGTRQELAAIAGAVAGAAARQAAVGALAPLDDPAQRERLAATARELGAGAAQSFGAELTRQLGNDGDGPLARAMTATAGRVAQASAAGAAREVHLGLGGVPMLLAFGAGILAALLAVAAFGSVGAWTQARAGLRLARRQPA